MAAFCIGAIIDYSPKLNDVYPFYEDLMNVLYDTNNY